MKNVLVVDSGSGGVNMLKSFTQAGIGCNFLMLCDQKNLPYGNKSPAELQKLTIENLKMIEKFFKFEIVVFACNTLSCTALEIARKTFPNVIFIGTEPAVRPALSKFCPEEILVLGTEVTLSQNQLIKQTKNLQLLPLPKLASLIDENLDDLSILKAFLRESLQEKQAKAVVLGCTHYVLVKNIISEVMDGAEIFDSVDGVTKRLKHFVGGDSSSHQVQFMVSGDEGKIPLFWSFYQNSVIKQV